MGSPFHRQGFWQQLLFSLKENKWLYLSASGIVGLFLVFCAILQQNGHLIASGYPIVLCITGCFITSRSFRSPADFNPASLPTHSTPSLFNKYLTAIVTGVLLFVPLFTLFYFLTGFSLLNIFHPPASPPGVDNLSLLATINKLHLTDSEYFSEPLLTYLLLQPFFLLMAIRFRKFQLFFGTLFVFGIFAIHMFLSHKVLIYFTPQLAYNYTYFTVSGPVGCWDTNLATGASELVNIWLKPWVYKANTIFYLIISASLYVIVWFSLLEKKSRNTSTHRIDTNDAEYPTKKRRMKKSNVLILFSVVAALAWMVAFQWISAQAVIDFSAGRLSRYGEFEAHSHYRPVTITKSLPVFSEIEIHGAGNAEVIIEQGMAFSVSFDTLKCRGVNIRSNKERLFLMVSGQYEEAPGIYRITAPLLTTITLHHLEAAVIKGYRQGSLIVNFRNVISLHLSDCHLDVLTINNSDDIRNHDLILDNTNRINRLMVSLQGGGMMKLGTIGTKENRILVSDSMEIQASNHILKQLNLPGLK